MLLERKKKKKREGAIFWRDKKLIIFSCISVTKILNVLLYLFSDFLYCKSSKFHVFKEQTPYSI